MVIRSVAVALITILAAIGARAQATWTPITTPTSDNLAAIDFTSATTGYAAGDNGTILKTTDGGTTWTLLANSFAGNFWHLRFWNDLIGIAAGDGGAAIRTTDGGATWTQLATGLKAGSLPSFIFGVEFISADTVVAVGGDGFAASGVVLTSSDTGTTWKKHDISGTFFLDRSAFTNKFHGYAVGATTTGGGGIYVSGDNGATWAAKYSAPLLITSVQVIHGDSAIAVGGGGMIHTTTNGGASWSGSNSPTASDLLEVRFHDSRTGIAVGDNGAVITTTNGGATWTDESISGGGHLTGVAFAANGNAFISGPSGIIYRRSFAAGVTTEAGGDGMRAILQPNPMHSNALLRIEGGEAWMNHAVMMYDALGREVLHGDIHGNGSLALDRAALPAGCYYYTVGFGNGRQLHGVVMAE